MDIFEIRNCNFIIFFVKSFHCKTWFWFHGIFSQKEWCEKFAMSARCNAQCGNLSIFLPLRFYVKSIWLISKSQKLQFWPFWRLSILIFGKIASLNQSKIHQNQILEPQKLSKWQRSNFSICQNLISRKIQWQKNCHFATLC